MPASLAAGVTPGTASVWVPALLIAVGILGVVIPVIPGLIVAMLGVLIWSIDLGTPLGWAVFGICLLWYAAGLTLQYLIPGRRLRAQGVGTGTLVLAAIVGIVGFFVVPVIGLPLGFVSAIYLVERLRSGDGGVAWTRTKHALKAVLTSVGIELAAGLLIASTWAVGVLTV